MVASHYNATNTCCIGSDGNLPERGMQI